MATSKLQLWTLNFKGISRCSIHADATGHNAFDVIIMEDLAWRMSEATMHGLEDSEGNNEAADKGKHIHTLQHLRLLFARGSHHEHLAMRALNS